MQCMSCCWSLLLLQSWCCWILLFLYYVVSFNTQHNNGQRLFCLSHEGSKSWTWCLSLSASLGLLGHKPTRKRASHHHGQRSFCLPCVKCKKWACFLPVPSLHDCVRQKAGMLKINVMKWSVVRGLASNALFFFFTVMCRNGLRPVLGMRYSCCMAVVTRRGN